MNILDALRKEEKVLLQKMSKVEHQANSLRTAIHALAKGNGNGTKFHMIAGNGHRTRRKMTAAHRAAIKRGWARRNRKLAKAA
jgi:hypothetical protein